MKLVTRILTVALVLSFVLSACAPAPAPTQASAPSGKKVVVGLVMKSLANQYFKDMQDGAQKWADANNVDLKPVGIQNETDVDAQIAAIENLITQKVDIIIIAPANSVALAPVAKKAVDAGITVVNMDVAFDPKALADNGLTGLPYVGPDNRIGSKLAGIALAKKLGKGGKVLILEGVSGADNATQRTNGFKDAVTEGGLVLIDSVGADWETEKANTVTTNELTAHPEIQGIMCDNDSMVLGAVKAVEAAGKLGQIQIVGFDNIAPVQDLIKKGSVLATVDQFSTVQAVNAIQVGLRMLKGEKVTGWQKTDVKLITAADLK
jgi:ribose transport system substrate-binding protein